MATDDTFSEPGERHINWGGVLKGAAIIAGVAVAAVVGVWALSALSSAYIMPALTSGAGSSLLAGAHSAYVWGAGALGTAAGSLVYIASGIPAGLASILGLTGQHFAQTATVNHTMGIIGGAVAGAAAVHATLPMLDHTHLTTTTPAVDTTTVDTGTLATQGINLAHMPGVVPLHDITHIAHHAAEHADEHASAAWTEKFQPRASYASYSDHALASKEDRHAKPQPAGSFTEQLNTERANLDQILAK